MGEPRCSRGSNASSISTRSFLNSESVLLKEEIHDLSKPWLDDPRLSKRQRVLSIGRRAKAKTQSIFNANDRGTKSDMSKHDQTGALVNVTENPAFNSSKFSEPEPAKSKGSKLVSSLHDAAQKVAHPVQAVKSKAAGKLATSETPFLSQKEDLEFIQAHEDLRSAQGSSRNSDDDSASDLERKQDKVRELEAYRQSMRVAFTTSRHVTRVKAVRWNDTPFPSKKDYEEWDDHGKYVRFQWERYTSHVLLYMCKDVPQYIDDGDETPVDREHLVKLFERLLIASSHWQAWVVDVRKVYRWEDPRKTLKWLLIYTVLWYYCHLITFVYCYIAFTVLKNRNQSTAPPSLRESYARTSDRNSSAYKFGEIIRKHGSDGWIDPIIDELGPWMQLQLGDLADFLECQINFYNWHNPRRSWYTLFPLAAAIAMCILADAGFCGKVFWLYMGCYFFLLKPIGSRYPQYRHVTSPCRWWLWGISTNAELSFQYLREQAQISRAAVARQKMEASHMPSDDCSQRAELRASTRPDSTLEHALLRGADTPCGSKEPAIDLLSFRGMSNRLLGHLIVSTEGLRFVRSVVRKEMWSRQYDELAELRKTTATMTTQVNKWEGLEFLWTNDSRTRLDYVKSRDECFNSIVGFSNLWWQNMRPLDAHLESRMSASTGRKQEGKARDSCEELLDGGQKSMTQKVKDKTKEILERAKPTD